MSRFNSHDTGLPTGYAAFLFSLDFFLGFSMRPLALYPAKQRGPWKTAIDPSIYS
jgi:hypothetical protein